MPKTLQVLDLGHGTYRLHTADRDLGWVAGPAIGFRGFRSVDAAARAAEAAHDALLVWLARQRRVDPVPRPRGALQVREQGDQATLTLGEEAIGWVMPIEGARHEQGGEFAFELRLPAALDPSLALGAARAVLAALDRRASARRLERHPSTGLAAAGG